MTELYYIEDDSNITNIVKEYLGQKGYDVSVFSLLLLMENKGKTLTKECLLEQI